MTSAVVIGDIFHDYVSDLSRADVPVPIDLPTCNADAVAPVLSAPGGAGAQFGIAAVSVGFSPVTIIGKVGGTSATEVDIEGRSALGALSSAGLRLALAIDPTVHTGRAMITYFAGDHRFMISDPGANATFEPSDLTPAMRDAVANADLLYVSGYSLVTPARRVAVRELIVIARAHGVTVALDLVPHEFEALVPRSTVDAMLGSIDWILLAAVTGRRLLGAARTASAEDVLDTLAPRIASVAVFEHPSSAKVISHGVRSSHTFTYVAGAQSRGQSARAHAELLHGHLTTRS
ncbi:hypothetical protein [Micromonospora sp. NPDC005710]|uniref:carbohydrate kinase family protein n=1 Tax=Micromonospora sp. NPDC005710 TaxID=3157051 RepID=UPI0033E1B5FE